MKVLGIGYGRHLFDPHNVEHERLSQCAKEVESFDQIIFTRSEDALQSTTYINNFTLHPTNSTYKLGMIFDAIRIGHRLIKQKKITIISTQDIFETGVVGLVLKWRHPAVLLQVQEHGDVLASSHWRKEKISNHLRYLFGMYLIQRADIVRVVSDRTKNFLRRYVPEEKLRKLAVTIQSESFGTNIPRQPIPGDASFTFLTAARFVPQKNFPLMLHAFRVARKEVPSIQLKIFGDGPQRTLIHSMISKLELTDAVTVRNWTTNLSKEMQLAQAYLLTSNYEGWARVLIEAMCSGLPVVTTDVGCVTEVVKDGLHGIVVPVADIEKLTDAMVKIAVDKEYYISLVQHLGTIDCHSLPGTSAASYAKQWVETMR